MSKRSKSAYKVPRELEDYAIERNDRHSTPLSKTIDRAVEYAMKHVKEWEK